MDEIVHDLAGPPNDTFSPGPPGVWSSLPRLSQPQPARRTRSRILCDQGWGEHAWKDSCAPGASNNSITEIVHTSPRKLQLVLLAQSCQCLALIPEHSISQREALSSSAALPPPLAAPDNPISLSVDLPVPDISHEWNHTLCVLLCPLLSLSIMFSKSIHVVVSVRASLLFMTK